jgi:hypothetical protein
MDEKHNGLAREMAAFCRESIKERAALLGRFPMLATLISAVLVVLAVTPQGVDPWAHG